MKSMFTFQTKKRLISSTVKSAKSAATLGTLFKDQKPRITLFGGDGTNCFAGKTRRDYEREKPSPFLKKFLRQSQPRTSKPEPKKCRNYSILAKSCRHRIG